MGISGNADAAGSYHAHPSNQYAAFPIINAGEEQGTPYLVMGAWKCMGVLSMVLVMT